MRLVDCSYDAHASAILDILNDAIANSSALYDYAPRAAESMVAWFKTKAERQFPVIGAESDEGQLLGFASYGTFRAWPAYKYTVENGVYIQRDHRGQGFGRLLMKALIERARAQDYHLIVAGIDAANAPSISLHQSLGFSHAGTIRHAAFKFGQWLDLAFYELRLETPMEPRDG